jgi:hypothetical protein
MKILAHKAARGAYNFNFDDTEVVLDSKDQNITS